MTYQVQIARPARRDIAGLPADTYRRVWVAITELANDTQPPGCAKLTGRDGWRIRIGDYRVLYLIDDALRMITVVPVGHRREVYR